MLLSAYNTVRASRSAGASRVADWKTDGCDNKSRAGCLSTHHDSTAFSRSAPSMNAGGNRTHTSSGSCGPLLLYPELPHPFSGFLAPPGRPLDCRDRFGNPPVQSTRPDHYRFGVRHTASVQEQIGASTHFRVDVQTSRPPGLSPTSANRTTGLTPQFSRRRPRPKTFRPTMPVHKPSGPTCRASFRSRDR